MATTDELFLLADQLKLSLLERQRTVALGLTGDKQDAQLGRSLTNLQEGIDRLIASQPSTQQSDNGSSDLAKLERQYEDLYRQFHGVAPTPRQLPPATTPTSPRTRRQQNVRFRDDPDTAGENDADESANRAALFADSQRYRDDPEDAAPDQAALDNVQIHAGHTQTLREQDEQLDSLSRSVGRQRMLGIEMGHELDMQNGLLTDVEAGVDRHTSALGRARRNLGTFARKSKDNWNWLTIGILIVILVLLIVVLN